MVEISLPKNLNLNAAIQSSLTRSIDHFPPLIIDRCLSTASDILQKYIEAICASTRHFGTETLAMPRKRFGPRPVQLLSPAARSLYTALVAALEPALPLATRRKGAWDEHRSFGLSSSDYVVELDIASCYEYIDHKLLSEELLLRSMDIPTTTALAKTLEQVASNGRGLPQMLSASDRLADAYLSVLDRRLARDGHDLHRYADDFRITASDWDNANAIIEKSAEYARDIGLILSSEKTNIYRTSSLVAQDDSDISFLGDYFRLAKDALRRVVYIAMNPYEFSEETEEGDDTSALRAAGFRLVTDWHHATTNLPPQDVNPKLRSNLAQSLALATFHDEALSRSALKDIVFQEPRKLEQVCQYIIARAKVIVFAGEESWRRLKALAEMGRQSPWAKLWILHATQEVAVHDQITEAEMIEWVIAQLDDRHETVRAEAAWTLAVWQKLPHERLYQLYANATEFSQPAIAAAAARQSDTPKQIMQGIKADTTLTREAAKWAQSLIPQS